MAISLRQVLQQRGAGVTSVCSAHPWVIRAAFEQGVEDESLLLLEATCNQVNQDGGYTGMQPADFRHMVEQVGAECAFPRSRLVLGGDHLGPNPWKHLPAAQAMDKAEEMVREYVKAGFTKIHLDASMSCADDPTALPVQEIAERAARLASAAERTAQDSAAPEYVIGTEVPTPGGATHALEGLQVTTVESAKKTWEVHREIFRHHGLDGAWDRILALVVQPGVEFSHDSVVDYLSGKAALLTDWQRSATGPVTFEAHSTDYQRPSAYVELVRDGFGILKVGPALTFAMREALFALESIEVMLAPPQQRSRLRETLNNAMLQQPADWISHYHGDEQQKHVLRLYSYSDRVRYYWHLPAVEASVTLLLNNLRATAIPESMLSQYMPVQYARVRSGSLDRSARALISDQIRTVLRTYAAAASLKVA